MSGPLDISVVVPTYNRGPQLETLLTSLLDQDAGGLAYEIVVVDNNSTDDTRKIVEAVASRDPQGRLRYVLEPRQGVSYARNTGVAQTTAPIIAFLDDDGVPGPDWVRAMKRAFDEHPEVDCIGGRITPRWVHPRPSWLTAAHWGPIAVQDRPSAAYLNIQQASSCLLSANLGCRREAFNAVGGFSPEYPRNQDREFELRLWRAGRQGLYLPAMEVTVEVPPQRLTRRYHRRWQATTGRYHALMRYRDTLSADGAIIEEPPDRPKIFGSPRFLYREFLEHLVGFLRAAVTFDSDSRFFHETRIWYFVSFFRTRWKTRTAPLTAAAGRAEAVRSPGR
jgi:glycosyltransferase involved in cell wall biosynthesis